MLVVGTIHFVLRLQNWGHCHTEGKGTAHQDSITYNNLFLQVVSPVMGKCHASPSTHALQIAWHGGLNLKKNLFL